uniref:Uncharacterized protein n=1 Tax=Acrobeloides nanus TaxID=290746 RepID=A0A914DBY2_9BILA
MAENRTPVYRITEKSAFKNAPPHILRELAINKEQFEEGEWEVTLTPTKMAPEQFEEGEWEVTLTPTKMAPFLRYCADRRLRTYAWNKWVTIAGWASDSMTFCNGTRIDGIVNQSYMYAKNLGFKNVADHQFCNKMAGSAD